MTDLSANERLLRDAERLRRLREVDAELVDLIFSRLDEAYRERDAALAAIDRALSTPAAETVVAAVPRVPPGRFPKWPRKTRKDP